MSLENNESSSKIDNNSFVNIELKVLNRSYFLRCSSANSDSIIKKAVKLDEKAKEVAKNYPGLSSDNILLITAMGLVDNDDKVVEEQEWIMIESLQKIKKKLFNLISILKIEDSNSENY